MTKYGEGRIPYQWRCGTPGYTYKKFFNNDVVVNIEKIKNYICENASNNSISIQEFITNMHSLLNSNIRRHFPMYQFALDINDLFPGLLDIKQGIHYGPGAVSSLNHIAENEGVNYDVLKNRMLENFKYDEIVFEHALCEYDKYSKYILGIKKIDSSAGNYRKLF